MRFEIYDYQSMQTAIAELCQRLKDLEVSEDGLFHSRLVANELVGNVLRHSGGRAVLHGQVNGGFIELTLVSEFPFSPPKHSTCAGVYSENGRGLFLVDEVSVERTLTEQGDIVVRIKR